MEAIVSTSSSSFFVVPSVPLRYSHQFSENAGPCPQADSYEDDILRSWDSDIKRAARHAARTAGFGESQAHDIAQEIRLRLLKVLRNSGLPSESYTRKVIQNAAITAGQALARPSNMEIHKEIPLNEEGKAVEGAVEFADTLPSTVQTDSVAILAVRNWLDELPSELVEIYQRLYVLGLSQSEAAAQMDVTQPRVAQLHAELLKRGRHHFGCCLI
jgi:RNA polymerase sigma factor (sigma-70 family)